MARRTVHSCASNASNCVSYCISLSFKDVIWIMIELRTSIHQENWRSEMKQLIVVYLRSNKFVDLESRQIENSTPCYEYSGAIFVYRSTRYSRLEIDNSHRLPWAIKLDSTHKEHRQRTWVMALFIRKLTISRRVSSASLSESLFLPSTILDSRVPVMSWKTGW
jgi:hypothetical protein